MPAPFKLIPGKTGLSLHRGSLFWHQPDANFDTNFLIKDNF